ncbi:MAG: hypothetical protein C0502_10175 [Opitutus sp.]|nr:hypothetical protein [Opitutus sp.]
MPRHAIKVVAGVPGGDNPPCAGRLLRRALRRAPPQFFNADSGTRFTVMNFARNSSSISCRVAGGMRFTKSSSGGRGP